MTEFDINQIPGEHKHTKHINPGTDTTINPVVIDDSYRERKNQCQQSQPKYRTCDGDCLSCDTDTYISCERRLNPYSYTNKQRCCHYDVCYMIHAHNKCINDKPTEIPCIFDSRKEINFSRCASHTPAHPPEAQQRIDAAIKELESKLLHSKMNLMGFTETEAERVAGYESGLEVAIALLQAGDME